MRSRAALVLYFALAGCNGNRVDGSVAGHAMEVRAGYLFHWAPSAYEITLSDNAGACDLWSRSIAPSNATSILIDLMLQDGGPYEFAPGVYQVGAQRGVTAHVVFDVADSRCGPMLGKSAVSGMVSVEDIGEDRAKGTFDFAFDTGDRISGAFDVGACAPQAGFGSGLRCQ